MKPFFSLKRPYDDPLVLFEHLRQERQEAIVHVLQRVYPKAYWEARRIGLKREDAEDITQECVLKFISQIRNGKYQFEGKSPVLYVLEGVKLHISTLRNKMYRRQILQEDVQFSAPLESPQVHPEAPDIRRLEQRQFIGHFLDQLDAGCRLLIQLHYLDEWSDQEVIEQQLTSYSTTAALKNKRCGCMKKLKELVQHYEAQFSDR